MKRALDVVLAAGLLIVTAPVMAAVAVVVRLRLGSPVLYRQRRAGYRGAPFDMTKIRTMTDARSADGTLLADSERLTPLGERLRATSLDELPELWHVLSGQMSFVGPRPLPIEYLDRYTPEQARRHDAKPGITGWAQINGRNQTTWEERFAMDVWYVDNRTMWLDLRILWRSVSVVLRREGISADGEATMPELPPLPPIDDN